MITFSFVILFGAPGQGNPNPNLTGRPEAAAAASLLVCAAGDSAAVARCLPVFEAVGRKTLLIGSEPKAAALTKLIGNFFVASIIESYVFGDFS